MRRRTTSQRSMWQQVRPMTGDELNALTQFRLYEVAVTVMVLAGALASVTVIFLAFTLPYVATALWFDRKIYKWKEGYGDG